MMMTLAVAEGWYPDDPETCLRLADALVALHFAVFLFVVIGQSLILVGKWRRWHWVGNRWFRGLHLGVIGYVAAVAAMGDLCPLTVWENELRAIAGKPIEQASFVGYWSHELLMVDVDVRVLAVLYVLFALLVFASLFLCPVRWRSSRAVADETQKSASV